MKRWLLISLAGVVLVVVAVGIAVVWIQGPAPEQVASPAQFKKVPVAFSAPDFSRFEAPGNSYLIYINWKRSWMK